MQNDSHARDRVHARQANPEAWERFAESIARYVIDNRASSHAYGAARAAVMILNTDESANREARALLLGPEDRSPAWPEDRTSGLLPDGIYRSAGCYWMVRHWWDDVPAGWTRTDDADPTHEVFAVVPMVERAL